MAARASGRARGAARDAPGARHRGPPDRPLAELVCSNSFRSDDAQNNAVGVIHEEMRRAGSLIMRAADAHKLPAGGALAVDRHGFSAAVQEALLAHPLVTLQREEVAGLPPADWEHTIIATGPLTSPALAEALAQATGEESLAFFDAIAPIVHHEQHRPVDRLEAVALRQGGPGRRRRRLLQLPARQGAVRRLRRRPAGRRQDRVQAVGSDHALLPGLPADRGDRLDAGRRACASGR